LKAIDAQALRQVAANSKIAYEQDIERINALIKEDETQQQEGGSSRDVSAEQSRRAHKIELEVFIQAYVAHCLKTYLHMNRTCSSGVHAVLLRRLLNRYDNAFAHLDSRKSALSEQVAAVQQELNVIDSVLQQSDIAANLQEIAAESSP